MTQPPDDAALVARHDDLAKQLFWADVMLGEHTENILPEWRDRWWETSASMPLSGPGFLLKWRTLAAVAATALEAKDRRIAEMREALEKLSISDVPRSDGKKWRADGLYSKLDQCAHGVAMYDDCTGCIENFARAAL